MLTGLHQATLTNNAEMAVFAAQMDLALVDLLEGYFERAAKHTPAPLPARQLRYPMAASCYSPFSPREREGGERRGAGGRGGGGPDPAGT